MLRTLARAKMETQISIYNGDCLNELERLNENSIDCIITDPPYELNFMGKGWDNAGVSFNKNTWEKCLRVLKPGGYLLAFGGTRTYHRIACAIEDAGFEIRDCIMWLYGSGFPKSMDIEKAINKRDGVEFKSKPAKGVGFMNSNDDGWHNTLNQLEQIGESSNRAKEWQGWGTALKPAYEPIIVARKPFKGSLVDNVLKNGVGGINIDACRVGDDAIKGGTMPDLKDVGKKSKESIGINKLSFGQVSNAKRKPLDGHIGRFPANVILTYDETDGDEVCGGFPYTKSTGGSGEASKIHTFQNVRIGVNGKNTGSHLGGLGDSGSAARYFYCAKASKKDRDDGLETFSKDITDDGRNKPIDNPYLRGKTLRHNTHPTVKPTELMQYLVRLVAPKNAIILDPFMGSGSTGKAVMYENKERNANYKFIGIEKDVEYCNIAKARIEKARGGQWKLV